MTRRWIVVADSPFVPALNGGQRENLGFVESLVADGGLAALVVPTDAHPEALGRDDDLDALRALVAPKPVFLTPRHRFASALPRMVTRPYIVASRPAPADIGALVGAQVPDPNGVVIYSLKSVDVGRAIAAHLGLPVVLRQHNLEGPYHHALARAERPPVSWLTHLEALRIHRLDRRLERAAWLAGIADISATDAAVRRARATVPVGHVPPFALGPARADSGTRWARHGDPVVVFVGALHVGTNQDAVRWFAEQVWPAVRAAHPGARWQVVGRGPTKVVHDLVAATPGAELHADVPDPTTYLRDAAVAVNPTVSGSGINIKLIEYLSVGIPVVSTTRGQSGLGLEAGVDLAVADDPSGFAHAVTRLLAPTQDAETLGAAGAAAAARLLDVDSSLALMDALMSGHASAAH